MWSSCFPRGKQGSGRVTSTDVVKAPLRPGRNARGKWDVGAPHGVSHISSSNPPPGGGHSCNFENDPVENEGANHFSVSAEVARCLSATQRLPSTGSQRGGPAEHAPSVTRASCWNQTWSSSHHTVHHGTDVHLSFHKKYHHIASIRNLMVLSKPGYTSLI